MTQNQAWFGFWSWLAVTLMGATCVGQWPQYGGPNRNFNLSSVPGPDLFEAGEWSIELGLGDAPPVVAGNRIYVTESAVTDEGHEAMQIRCLDPINGATLWQTLSNDASFPSQDISQAYPVRPMASPLAISDRLVGVSFGGWVTCVSQESGRTIWQYDLVSEFGATPLQYGWASSPWSDGEVVVVACGGPQALVVAFELESGKLAWKSTPGEAAYGSFTAATVNDQAATVNEQTVHLCYMGQDQILGLDPRDGRQLWNFPLPNPGRTNAVTPVALPNGELLVAGQGFDSCRRLKIRFADTQWTVEEVWKSKHFPFYCNWLIDPETQQYVAFASKVLGAVNLEDGKLNWRERGWTDANFCLSNDTLVGVRGDGVLAVAKLTVDSLELIAGARVVDDRVWAAPVVVGQTVLIRGRNSLTAARLSRLPAIDKMPPGTEIDSMAAMYGQQNEKVAGLLERAKSTPAAVTFADYLGVAQERSIRFGENEYQAILNALKQNDRTDLCLQIAQDWVQREPESIVAYDTMLEVLRRSNPEAEAASSTERMVEVEFDVVVPSSTPRDAAIFIAGNAAALGNWKPDGLPLTRSADGHYRATVTVPTGLLEFKLTQGSWESCEVQPNGGSVSNRRQRLRRSMSIRAEVQAWLK